MKILVCYNDHDDNRYHKTVRITTPTPWGKKPLSLTIIKKFIKSYNTSISKLSLSDTTNNELDPEQVHLAYLLNDSGMYIPIPVDVPITDCITDETKMIYLRHGPSLPQAVLEAQQQQNQDEQERDETNTPSTKKIRHCARYGCMNEYNDRHPVFGPCLFHKAPPVFHVNEMYWACCKTKRVSKFTDLMKMRGCETAASCTLDDNLFLQEVNQVNEYCQYTSNESTKIVPRTKPTNKYTNVGIELCPTITTRVIQELASDDEDDKKLVDQLERLKYKRFKQHVATLCKDVDDKWDYNDNNTIDSMVYRNTKALLKFKRVLHSFGVDSILYDHVIEGMKEDYELLEMDDERLNATIKAKLGKMLQQGFEAVATQQTKQHLRGRNNYRYRQQARKNNNTLKGMNPKTQKLEYNISEESSIVEEIELHPVAPYKQGQHSIEMTTKSKNNEVVIPYNKRDDTTDESKKSTLVLFGASLSPNKYLVDDPLTKPNGLYSRLFTCTPPPEGNEDDSNKNKLMTANQLRNARNKSLILDNSSDHAIDGDYYFVDCMGESSSKNVDVDGKDVNKKKKKSAKTINQRFYERLQQQKQQYVTEEKQILHQEYQQQEKQQQIQQPIRRLSLCGCDLAVTE